MSEGPIMVSLRLVGELRLVGWLVGFFPPRIAGKSLSVDPFLRGFSKDMLHHSSNTN